MWRHELRILTDELIGDCEAFVLGRFAERLEAHSVAVPVWAWTNLLAHGTEEDLRAEQTQSAATRVGSVHSRAWRAARSYLVTEVLEVAGHGGSLAELQREVLAPLELQLAEQPGVERWDRQRWVNAVRSSLAEHRHMPRP